MSGQINYFRDLAVVRASDDAEGWIVTSGFRRGVFGPALDRFWQVMGDGTVRFGDPATQSFYASIKICLEDPRNVSVFAGETHLWIVPAKPDQGDAVCIDLASASIAAHVANLSCNTAAQGRVTGDGNLIFERMPKFDDVSYNELTLVDPISGEMQTSRTILPRNANTMTFCRFFASSPCATFWLRLDHTHFPMVERSAAPGGAPRKYYGLTVQVWSAFPLRFERRIVVAWLKAEDLPDQTYILRSEALWEFNRRINDEEQERRWAAESQPANQSGEDSEASADSVSWHEELRAIFAASAPERDRIYSCISQGLHRPDAKPDAPFPTREAYGEAAHDDALWEAVTRNLEVMFRDELDKIVGWDGEEAIWFDRLGHLICVGMDGRVSPQIWFARAGLRRGMVRPFAYLPGRLEVLPGRRLLAVQQPFKSSQHGFGCLIVDGSPGEPRYEPLCVLRDADGWQGAEAIPQRWLNEDGDFKAVEKYRKTRSTVTIPLASLDAAGRAAAIDAYRNLLTPAFFNRARDSAITVRFKSGDQLVTEYRFFMDLGPQDRDWAVGPLRALIARYAELKSKTGDTTYQDIDEPECGSLLAQAAMRLGEMDESALPILIAYGEGIDGGHEYFFAGDTMPAVIEAHGWTQEVTAFVAWTLAFNFYNTYDCPTTIWEKIGLGNALKEYTAPAAAAFIHNRLSPLVEAGRLEWRAFVILQDRLGDGMDRWERAFFSRLMALVGETN